jgi:hypothetical protein
MQVYTDWRSGRLVTGGESAGPDDNLHCCENAAKVFKQWATTLCGLGLPCRPAGCAVSPQQPTTARPLAGVAAAGMEINTSAPTRLPSADLDTSSRSVRSMWPAQTLAGYAARRARFKQSYKHVKYFLLFKEYVLIMWQLERTQTWLLSSLYPTPNKVVRF